MGCDIHCFVEKQNLETKEWHKITGFVSDMYDESSVFFSTDQYLNAESPLEGSKYFQEDIQ